MKNSSNKLPQVSLTFATSLLLGIGITGPTVVQATEGIKAETEKEIVLTEEEVLNNDRVLYSVNAGTPDPSVVPKTEKMGLLQSNVDQKFSKDSKTGMAWGADPDNEYSSMVKSGSDATDIGESFVYMSDKVMFDKEKSMLGYSFELPKEKIPGMKEQTYEVTVAFKHYWEKRWLNIMLEGQTVDADREVGNNEWVSKTFVTTVTDGELNVAVKAPRRSGPEGDPIINYIKVQAVTEKEPIAPYTSFTGTAGDLMYDTNGNTIQAHGGQVQKLTVDGETKYYWIGEDKTYDYRPVGGIHLYTSTDLYNWKDEGVVLKPMETRNQFETDEYFKSLYGDYSEEKKDDIFIDLDRNNTVIERPKMLYNDKTGKYVIWFHADGRFPGSDADYGKAKAGVAISDSPTGPFKLLGSYKLNYHNDPNGDYGFDGWAGRGSVRDMTLFKDTDGQAYVIYSSEGNKTTIISKLNDDYTNLAVDLDQATEGVDFTREFIHWSREAPAMFNYKDKYYMISSGQTGWSPNPAQYAVADSPMGPWHGMGDPSADWGGNTTYDTQSTHVIPVDPENGKFIYMGDRWNSWDLSESRYVWLPIEFKPGNQLAIRRADHWTLDQLDDNGLFDLTPKGLPKSVLSMEGIADLMPNEVTISYGTETEVTPIEWQYEPYNGKELGTVFIKGYLPEKNQDVWHDVHVAPKGLRYFFDSGADESVYFDAAKDLLGETLLNTKADQKYTKDNKAGYLGTTEEENPEDFDFGRHKGKHILDSGWWANQGKSIDYAFDLEAGTYELGAGLKEWWNATRQMELTIKLDDDVLGKETIKLSSDNPEAIVNKEFTLAKAGSVVVSLKKQEGSDPVLSWLSIVEKESKVVVNFSVLVDKLAKANKLIETDYQADAWAKFVIARNAASAVKDDPTATQAIVDKAVTALESAIAELMNHLAEGQPEVESISLNAKTIEVLKVGKQLTVGSSVLPKNASTNLTWSVQKDEVASVDVNGVVTAKKAGTTHVYAKAINGKEARFTLRVTR
ncbi:hypothetical protein ATZ33_07445 [Enterococcus silesiacus]|uniref:BIG2 domain-containing protein n=1 Tax=Enterococcus silesiacus TaxID=332949 RepID=A0A0S3KAA8_9ENTE|nr:family 43 glycosylhydrolase [Enterococcus silesiacus]ALS01207.1 hypothetical protein ATZ33_07445 [Enterococcus silesiacus]OJG92607.1 hypothetical protein RV15_GL003032 [Enterococcus silesiacus]